MSRFLCISVNISQQLHAKRQKPLNYEKFLWFLKLFSN